MAEGDQVRQLDPTLGAAVREELERWEREGHVGRLWRRDPSLWTSSGEERWLGWLEAAEQPSLDALEALGREVAAEGVSDVLLLGMGGSSLAPEVLGELLSTEAATRLHVLDSTDPSQIRTTLARIPLERALIVVSSKSGTTLETACLADYLLERVRRVSGHDGAGRRCIAITDPGSALEGFAREARFRQVWHGEPTIGGRFSALSNFGLVPAAALAAGAASE